MTIETIREHEARALDLYKEDFRRKSLERLAQRYVVGRQVLDMRCFTGDLCVELAIRGFEVLALDGYFQAVELTNTLARSRGLEQPIAKLWDLTGLVALVGENRFDTVICMDVLNHVRDDQETIGEVARVLMEGGRLILVAPAFPALHGKRDEVLGHLRRYTKKGLRSLLERNGLSVHAIRYWNFTALPVYFLFEKVLRREVSDRLRSGRGGLFGSLPNQVLGWWYRVVENRLFFPCGLSLFVIAHKQSKR